MSGNHHLYVPGPSNVPAAVQQAIHCPMEDHRNPTIPGLITPLVEDLKKIVLTKKGKVVFSLLQELVAGKLLFRARLIWAIQY